MVSYAQSDNKVNSIYVGITHDVVSGNTNVLHNSLYIKEGKL